MLRRCYLLALCVLQVMFAWQLVPAIAVLLTRHVPLGHAADGWPAVLEITAAALSVTGAGLALSYPCIVIMRHVQRGVQRFSGLPRWAVTLTLLGTALLSIEGAVRLFGPWLPLVDERPLRSMLPLATPGVALMCAGALLAELLRRSRPARARVLASVGPIVRLRRVSHLTETESPMRCGRVA
ncbi:MAG: hypothetical protein M3Z31_05505 [Pseudomonadota bacterium]|nr:hypothetical protein [Pseudomonadota bacterium]